MRASAASPAPDRFEVVVARRRLPRPVVWLLWLLGALLGSVVLGFLAGLARPRDPDPWAPGAPYPPPETATPDPYPPAAEGS